MATGSVKSRGIPFLHVLTPVPGGTIQTDATAIVDSSPALVLSAGTSWGGIRLPTASRGKTFWIQNTGTHELAQLRVYPATGDSINELAADTYLEMEEGASAMFIASSSTVWYTVPRVPS